MTNSPLSDWRHIGVDVLDITTQGNTGFTGSRHQRLQRKAFQRHAHAGHRHHHTRVAGRHYGDLASPRSVPRVVSTPVTAPAASRLMPVTSQFWMMSTPSASAARA